jgi:hypothetical protein
MRGAHDSGSERELSWLGWTVAEAITPYGKSVLFSEEGEPTGSTYFVAIRSFGQRCGDCGGDGRAHGGRGPS